MKNFIKNPDENSRRNPSGNISENSLKNPSENLNETSIANTLHKQFSEYGLNAKSWMKKCILLLPQIQKHQVWKKKGFVSIYEYAAKLAGISRAKVDDALWVLHKIEDKPALKKIVEQKGINSIRPVVAIATTENANFWAEKAKMMSVHTLETYVKEFKNYQEELRNVTKSESSFGFTEPSLKLELINMMLDPETAEQLKKLKGQKDWNILMKQLLDVYKKQVEEKRVEMEVDLEKKREKIESKSDQKHMATSRHIPVTVQRYVLSKTNNTCSFPNCEKPAKILHHTQRFSLKHNHDPEKIAPLCEEHERIAHHGLIQNENREAKKWKISENPDYKNPRYEIDRAVLKYRSRENLKSQDYS